MSDQLTSWHDTPTRAAIVDFVERVTTEGGPDYVPPAERIATFDNDGTLWCEKPMPIELGFILDAARRDGGGGRVAARRSSRGRRRTSKDYAWLGEAITKHYHGDDGDLKVLMGGIAPGVRRQERRATTRPPPTPSCAAASTRRSAARSTRAATCR